MEEAYEVNERHSLLEKKIYLYSKNPPAVTAPPLTILQKIDILVIPDVLFATNSYAISKAARLLLDSLLAGAQSHMIDSVVVEGHTDSTGSVPLNEKLSQNRASSVAAYMAPAMKSPIVSRGWASVKPVADNRTAVGRQKNRRVEIYLYRRE
jgi:outer membrane protein OmpA-like peptidoglycan-associated protein